MQPVEAPCDIPLRVFHRLGSNQFVLSLQLWAGDDVLTRVLEVFQQGQLPSCFFHQTLEYATLAVREALAEEEDGSLANDLPSAISLPSSEPVNPVRSQPGSINERLRVLQLRGLIPPDSCSWGPQLRSCGGSQSWNLTFWCAYDFLLRHRPTFFRTIGTLEESYLKGIRELRAGRAVAISELQRCQSMEMEKVRQEKEEDGNAPVDIHVLVGQHVSEIDALELHWQSEIEQLKGKQKASYRELVVDFFQREMEMAKEETGLAPEDEVHSEPNLLRQLARPLRPEPLAPEETNPVSEEEPQVTLPEGSRLTQICEVRTVFGRQAFFVLRLWIGDVMDFAGGAAETEVPTADDGDGAGPQLPKTFLGIDSYGRQDSFVAGSAFASHEPGGLPRIQAAWTKTRALPNHVVRGQFGGIPFFRSASLRFWEAPRLPPPVTLSPNAYSDKLRGIVIPTLEHLKFETSQASMLREFAMRCARVSDFHFSPLSEQLQAIKEQELSSSGPLRAGDYFCTRHSNLGGQVQAAFHLLVAAPLATAPADEVAAPVHRALKRMLWDCHRCRVSELTIPLLLLDIGTFETSLPYAVAQRRAENSLRALKGALTALTDDLSPSELPGLELINLVLPLSCSQSISSNMPSVASTTQTFLRHSFQCV
eukprot:s4595_g3.t1